MVETTLSTHSVMQPISDVLYVCLADIWKCNGVSGTVQHVCNAHLPSRLRCCTDCMWSLLQERSSTRTDVHGRLVCRLVSTVRCCLLLRYWLNSLYWCPCILVSKFENTWFAARRHADYWMIDISRENVGDIKSPTRSVVHQNAAIFGLVWAFDHILLQ